MQNKKKPKDILTHEQFRQQCQAKCETGITNWWLKTQGINPRTFAHLDAKVLDAQRKMHELRANYETLLTEAQKATLDRFKEKLSSKRACSKLKPGSAYPILNIYTKIIRQAHNTETMTRQRIEAMRYNHPLK